MLRKFAGNSMFYVAAMLLNRGIAFLVLPLYTRHLTPTDYGLLAICGTATSILSMTIALCLDSAISRFYFEFEAEEYERFLRTAWLGMTVIPLILVGSMEFWAPLLVAHYFPAVPWHPYLRLAVWIAYFTIAPMAPLSLLRTEERAPLYGAFTVGSFLLTMFLLVYFVVVREGGALGSLHGQLISAVIMAMISHGMILTRVCSRGEPWVVWRHLKTALRFSLPYMPYTLALWAMNLSDRLILARFVPMSTIGLYSLAYTLGMILQLLGVGVMTALTPIYFRHASEPNFRDQLRRLLTGCVMVYTWAALAISLMAREILRVMTRPAYLGAAELVPWIAAGYWLFVTLYQPYLMAIEYRKRTALVPLLMGAPALLNIALNVLFIPRFGVQAAAVNTTLAFLLLAIMAVGIVRRFETLPYPWETLVRMVVVAGIAYSIGVRWLSPPELIPAILAKGALLLVTGGVMACLAGYGLTGSARERLASDVSI